MHQSMLLAKKRGFNPELHTHLVFVIQTSMKDTLEEILKLNKENASDRRHAHLNKASIQDYIGKYNALAGILQMLDCSVEQWYCARCGFLDPTEVTNDELCVKCGGTLPL